MTAESPLTCVRRVVAQHFGRDIMSLSADTRIDDLETDELRIIDLAAAIEKDCGCELPDFEITTTATLGQLAAMVERYRRA